MEEVYARIVRAGLALPYHIVCIGVIFVVAKSIIFFQLDRIIEQHVIMHQSPVE